jgi:hypothetical protein
MAKAAPKRRSATKPSRGPAARRGSKSSTQTSLGAAIEAVQEFIERAGKTLSDESRSMLEHAKSILQGHHESSGRKGSKKRTKKRTARKAARRAGTARKSM